MLTLKNIIEIFSKGRSPKGTEFEETWKSFWHKSERLNKENILGLNEDLANLDVGKVDNVDLYNTNVKVNELDQNKASKEDLASVANGGLNPMGNALNMADLKTKPKRDKDSYFVLDQTDEIGDPYIFKYDAELADWINTKQTVYKNVARQSDIVDVNNNIGATNNGLNLANFPKLIEGSIENYTIAASTGVLSPSNTRLATMGVQFLPVGDYRMSINKGYDYCFNEYNNSDGTAQFFNSGWINNNVYTTRRNNLRLVFRRSDDKPLTIADWAAMGFTMAFVGWQSGTLPAMEESLYNIGDLISANISLDNNISRGTTNGSNVVGSTTRLITTNIVSVVPNTIKLSINEGFQFAIVQYNMDESLFLDSSWTTTANYELNKSKMRIVFRKKDDSAILLSDWVAMGFKLEAKVYKGVEQQQSVFDGVKLVNESDKTIIDTFEWKQGTVSNAANPEYCHSEWQDFLQFSGNRIFVKIKAEYRMRFVQSSVKKAAFDKESALTDYSPKDRIVSFDVSLRYISVGLIHAPNGVSINQTPADIPNDAITIVVPPTYKRLDSIQRLSLTDSIDTPYFGYYYLESDSKKRGALLTYIDVQTETKQGSLQSLVIDKLDRSILIFNGSKDVFKFSFDRQFLGKLSKPDTGHDNDAYIVDKTIFYNGSTALGGEANSKLVYMYDTLFDNLKQIDTSQVINPIDSMRVIGGICDAGNNQMLLATHDYRGSWNSNTDKLGVYNIDMDTNTTTLLFELPWSGWFIQGCTCVNDILYVATNKLPESTNPTIYGGISVWAIDMKTQSLMDNVNIDGNIEPEGIEYSIENGDVYLYMGIGKYGVQAKILKFKAPY